MTRSSSGGAAPVPPRAIDCQEARVSLGVYVLGAIDPAERSLVDGHLAACRDCRDELAGLAGLPALLARVSAAEAAALAGPDGPPEAAAPEPPGELLATVIGLTAARRRRRRRLEAALGAVAAAAVAAGVLAGVSAGSSPAGTGSAAAGARYAGAASGPWKSVSGTAHGMTATVSYRAMGWGTQLDTEVTGIPVGTRCELWVTDATGQRTLAGGWVTDGAEGTVWYPGSAAVAAASVRSFAVTVASGQAIEVTA